MWEETGVAGKNPRAQAENHHTLSHTTTANHGVRTRVAAARTRVHGAQASISYYDDMLV